MAVGAAAGGAYPQRSPSPQPEPQNQPRLQGGIAALGQEMPARGARKIT
eukprot:CAMPEP_0118880320 /NCGR_PEP_ID=MMETSP1163-20130328/19921_1 /TAXON_ID=124430 /ORGANISM="Phaeomonas parva, Strain CCMP2877" /LENGTH=48 /DNA_ID= /DNA_START= /DNA_END= /DNA_ORIENTATION=